MARFWAVVLLVIALLHGLANSAHCQDRIWRPYFELEGRGGTRELGQGSLFLPLWQDCRNLVFADFRGLWTDVQSSEGNWGLAFRNMEGNWITGVYGFYDARRSQFDNTFHQATFGGEVLSVDWGFRANGYIPESGVKNAASAGGVFLQDGNLVVKSGVESAYWGLDLEAERLLWWAQGERAGCQSPWSLDCLDAEIWGSAGLYHFENDNTGFENITGPRARLELRLHDFPLAGPDSRLVASVQYEHDSVRGSVSTGMLSVRIPFGPGGGRSGRRLSPLERRMVNPIVRDIDVVTHTAITTEPAVLAATGEQFTSVVSVDANDDLAAELSAAGPNSLVMIDGSAGPVNAGRSVVQNGQTVGGGGTQLAVVGADSGTEALFRVPGVRPTVINPNGSKSGIWINNNATIQGLDITGGMSGIRGQDVSGFVIADNHISDSLSNAIRLGGTNNGLIVGNTLTDNPQRGLYISTLAGGLVSGNTASDNGTSGFTVEGVSGDAVISDNVASGNTQDGLQITVITAGTVSENTAHGNGQNGFRILDFDGGTFSDNVATDNTVAGYDISGSGGTALGNTGNGNGSNDVYP